MTQKFSFRNDYMEGAHPEIMKAIAHPCSVQLEPYGMDIHSENARKLMSEKLNIKPKNIHFVSGGTQANVLVIDFLLKPYEAVIAVDTGHINVHETGAVESVGHKIITVAGKDGKLRIEDIQKVLDTHVMEHQVHPKLVYISQTTELGTIYNSEELQALYAFCLEKELILFIDGARMAQALGSTWIDLEPHDITENCDVSYWGGTKNGGMYGEAILFNDSLDSNFFRYEMKQKGALLAKSWWIGRQFERFFTDDLYFELGTKANEKAHRLAMAIADVGYEFYVPAESNQLFPIFPKSIIKELQKDFEFYIWEELDAEKAVVRLVCSWATPDEKIETFVKKLIQE